MKPNLALILAITAALGALPLATEGSWGKGGGGVTAEGVMVEVVTAEGAESGVGEGVGGWEDAKGTTEAPVVAGAD